MRPRFFDLESSLEPLESLLQEFLNRNTLYREEVVFGGQTHHSIVLVSSLDLLFIGVLLWIPWKRYITN